MGAFLHRVCELRWPNRGGSIASIPLALLMLTAEVAYLVTDCDSAAFFWLNGVKMSAKVFETYKSES